jgi:hypothetical protein
MAQHGMHCQQRCILGRNDPFETASRTETVWSIASFNVTKEIENGVMTEMPLGVTPALKILIEECWDQDRDRSARFKNAVSDPDKLLFPGAHDNNRM